MGETRRSDFTAIGLIAAVRNKINAKLALRGLNRGVDLARRHMKAFCEKLEVMDQGFHRPLHFRTRRRRDFMIRRQYRAATVCAHQPVNALTHDGDRLTHFFHSDDGAIITIAVLANRNIKVQFFVAFIGL